MGLEEGTTVAVMWMQAAPSFPISVLEEEHVRYLLSHEGMEDAVALLSHEGMHENQMHLEAALAFCSKMNPTPTKAGADAKLGHAEPWTSDWTSNGLPVEPVMNGLPVEPLLLLLHHASYLHSLL